MNQKNKMRTSLLTRIGVLGSLSFVIMMAEFYIGFAEFLKLDLSDIIAMIGGITMGPIAAIGIQVIKNLLKVIIVTRTAGIGELANLIVGIAYVLPAVLIYQKIKTNKGLLLGLTIGGFSMIIIACLANFFLLLPAYWSFLSQESMTAMARWSYITIVILPFNLVKAIAVSILTYLAHLSLKPLYKHLVLQK